MKKLLCLSTLSMITTILFLNKINTMEQSLLVAPTIETKRCLLREMQLADDRELFELGSDERIAKYFFAFSTTHRTLEDTRNFIERRRALSTAGTLLSWVIANKESRKLIGLAYLHDYKREDRKAGLGIALSPDFWGQGFAGEVAKDIAYFAFTALKLVRLEATCDPRNKACRRVMQKCGMHYEGLLRNYHIVHGKPCDREMFSVTDKEFEQFARPKQQEVSILEILACHYCFLQYYAI